jgi:lipoyl(octanoyl) transferase
MQSDMRVLSIQDLGSEQPYAEVLALQEQTHAARCKGSVPDTLFLLEHRRVYTLGRSAEAGHLLYSEEALQQAGIDRVQTTRGGDVTYHGPGQLVGYPVIHLGEANLRVLEYVTALEESLIQAVSIFGIEGHRDARNRGVWVGNNKLAAIGIRVAHAVTMHGFALNVNTTLADYSGIVACGLQDAGVTSMNTLLGRPIGMQAVKQAVVASFKRVLHYD